MKRVVLMLLGLIGCALTPSAKGPMERVEFPHRPGKTVDRLIVMIHGRGDNPRSFEKNGFLDELAQRAIPIDVVAVYAHVGYFAEKNFGQRLHDDVIMPKRRAGYREIYVLGVSRGGLGALAFARRYSGEPDALILFAPFLGPGFYVDEIRSQGGLSSWRPNPPIEEIETVWQWLQGYSDVSVRPPLELMWGKQDDFRRHMNVLAAVLQDHRAHSIEGGHDWKTWRKLWADFLDRDPFGWTPRLDTPIE